MISEKLITIAENERKVYESGHEKGVAYGYKIGTADGYFSGFQEGKTQGLEEGYNLHYNEFWDVFQQNGTRRKYDSAFYNPHHGWDGTTFDPKYDIICEGSATQMFYAWENLNTNADIGAILKRNGITINTSQATNLVNFMAYGKSIIGTLPTISCESAKANTKAMFRNVQITKIEKLIVTELTDFTDMFLYCSNLAEIEFEGTIATGALNMSSCKNLNAASLYSIINALSASTSGLTITLPTTAEANYNANPPAGAPQTWAALIATRQNWSYAYA